MLWKRRLCLCALIRLVKKKFTLVIGGISYFGHNAQQFKNRFQTSKFSYLINKMSETYCYLPFPMDFLSNLLMQQCFIKRTIIRKSIL